MARYEDALGALNPFRIELHIRQFGELERLMATAHRRPVSSPHLLSAFLTHGASRAFATPLTNVHATGVGVRVRRGRVKRDEFVLKVYVFQKLRLGDATPGLTKNFNGVEIDVVQLPVQWAFGRKPRPVRGRARVAQDAPESGNDGSANVQTDRSRPISGGASVSPEGARYIGTLGCFVKSVSAGATQIFALSNNHVFADLDALTFGTPIVQPALSTSNADVFASLSNFVPIQVQSTRLGQPNNLFDAAIAQVSDPSQITQGSIVGINNYDPTLDAPLPSMEVIKSGRATGVTTGLITGIHVSNVQINYTPGEPQPLLATFDDTIQITGDGQQPFSSPGNSGSVILNKNSGRPVGLLIGGCEQSTTACDLGGVCRYFQILPV